MSNGGESGGWQAGRQWGCEWVARTGEQWGVTVEGASGGRAQVGG